MGQPSRSAPVPLVDTLPQWAANRWLLFDALCARISSKHTRWCVMGQAIAFTGTPWSLIRKQQHVAVMRIADAAVKMICESIMARFASLSSRCSCSLCGVFRDGNWERCPLIPRSLMTDLIGFDSGLVLIRTSLLGDLGVSSLFFFQSFLLLSCRSF